MRWHLLNILFNEDVRGRWYFNVVVSYDPKPTDGRSSVGVDLGCKDTAINSNGEGVRGRDHRALEQALGIAQRAKKKGRIKAIHAKIRNLRQDALHKYSRKLVNEHAAIFVGNVSSLKLVKTSMAKSVLETGWGTLKTLLEYRCDHAGVVFQEINEAYSTQRCWYCQAIPASRPKARAALGIREWTCSECGVEHNRDINAARNILAVEHGRLAVGIPVLQEDVNSVSRGCWRLADKGSTSSSNIVLLFKQPNFAVWMLRLTRSVTVLGQSNRVTNTASFRALVAESMYLFCAHWLLFIQFQKAINFSRSHAPKW